MKTLLTTLLLLWATNAFAYTPEDICNAIYQAEGGAKTKHPYGILTTYKTTTPRQACINTVKHRLYDWNVWTVQHGKYCDDFILYLGSRYCPIGAKNDPKSLNINWTKNVKYFLNKRS